MPTALPKMSSWVESCASSGAHWMFLDEMTPTRIVVDNEFLH